MPKNSALSLAMRGRGGKENLASPMSPKSPGSPNAVYGGDSDAATPTAPYHNMPDSPASPKLRKDSKSIFSNFGATKSSTRVAAHDQPARQIPDKDIQNPVYPNGQNGGSTPELSRSIRTPNSDDLGSDKTGSEQRTNGASGKPSETSEHDQDKRTQKPKKSGMLGRSKSIKIEDSNSSRSKLRANPPKISPDPSSASWNSSGGDSTALKTAPLDKGQSWRGNMAIQNSVFSKLRSHSADRHEQNHRDDDASSRRDRAEQSSVASGSFNEGRGATLMSSLGSGARKMGEKMDSARKGVFGKLGRSHSNHERDMQIPKEQYQFKIIHLPLVEQTRKTRISARLEDSKDKTEFWMPALPWRCIDYLNLRGCEEEGLYRVPGAAHTVKYYEQKFDQDRDIDLIGDENLNDPNVIGSLFKNWLRQLPDEIFPKATQAKIQHECQGVKTTPQMLKDELSKLPPFNYYLLFAITCHISLLHSCSEFNKMNYNNLCICFQPAIKIEAFCFQFLILDWRNCWQGCWTEKEYLAEELKLLEGPAQQSTPAQNGHATQASGRSKGSQSSGFLGDSIKAASTRSVSTDRTKPSSRGLSTERNKPSARSASPTKKFSPAERPNTSKHSLASERDSSSERAISSSDSREAFSSRETPKRAPASVTTGLQVDEEDASATPTQAQHSRKTSEPQFRLDLNGPPNSPFAVNFS